MEDSRPKLQLSDREQQLIKLASSGQTDTAIAHSLGISEATVSTYWGRIRIKLGPYSRTELVSIVLKSEQEVALAELKEANAELARKLEVASGAEDAFYKNLIDNAADAIVLVSENGTITSANQAAEELFGYAHAEMEGLHVTALVPPRYREQHLQHVQGYMGSPSRKTMGEHLATPAAKKDGAEFEIRASLSAIAAPSGLVIMCAVRPV